MKYVQCHAYRFKIASYVHLTPPCQLENDFWWQRQTFFALLRNVGVACILDCALFQNKLIEHIESDNAERNVEGACFLLSCLTLNYTN